MPDVLLGFTLGWLAHIAFRLAVRRSRGGERVTAGPTTKHWRAK